MGQPVKDRRGDRRFEWSSDDITRATLRPGCPVHVVDVSAGGALLEAERPLRPGARVHLQVVTRLHVFAVIATVLRCEVWTLDSPQGVIYRGALQFEERCDRLWEGETPMGCFVPASAAPVAGLEGR